MLNSVVKKRWKISFFSLEEKVKIEMFCFDSRSAIELSKATGRPERRKSSFSRRKLQSAKWNKTTRSVEQISSRLEKRTGRAERKSSQEREFCLDEFFLGRFSSNEKSKKCANNTAEK